MTAAVNLHRFLLEKGYSEDQVHAAADRILDEPHLRLVSIIKRVAVSEWGEKTVADLLHEPGNEALFQQVKALKSQSPEQKTKSRKVDACYKDMQIYLLTNIKRNPKRIGNIVQRFMQGMIIDKGYPSEHDKGVYRKAIVSHNTNLGSVVSHSGGVADHVIVMRSGKSDNRDRLRELAEAACREEFKSTFPKGFTADKSEFQLIVTSYLDQSFLKALPEFGQGEAAAFKEIMKAARNWKDFTITIDGQKVVIKRPVIHNQLFSTTVRGIGIGERRFWLMGQKRADVSNQAANLFLQERFTNLYPKEPPLNTKERAEYDLVAKSLHVTISRKLPNTFQEVHAADLAIYKNILFEKLNLSQAVQCKSGTDRTAIAVALAVAQDAFKKQYGTDFDPEKHNGPPEREKLLFFKGEFRKALKEFGVSITIETKGYSGLKWGGGVPIIGGVANPVAHKYLYHEGDHGKTPDVVGLSYIDIAIGGRAAYKGQIRDPMGLYGKSKALFKRRLDRCMKSLKPEVVQKAVSETCKFLAVPEDTFTSKLQLRGHISELQLDIPKIEQKISKLTGTKEPAEQLQLYMLQQIVFLKQRSLL